MASDTTLNAFLGELDTAGLMAYTPVPPTPAAGPDPLYLIRNSDTNVLYYWDGGAWQPITSGAFTTRAIVCAIDGGGDEISDGIKCDVYVPYDCLIVAATLLADQSGDIEIDIWKQALGSYPPDAGNSIVDVTPPTISGTDNSQDTTLTDWDTAIAAGDTLRFNVNSCTDIERVQLTLTVVS